MSLCYDFEKWTMITLASIAISLTVGLLLINFGDGILIEHKGEFYCYNENTTSRAEVLKEKERNSIDETIYQNTFLGQMAEDNFELAEKICQSANDQGLYPRDNQGDELELEGTLTLEIK
jgi:hypothetical protein